MKISREVIGDLLPAYFSGEASQESRALVEQFLRDDPQFAAEVQRLWGEDAAELRSLVPAAPDVEKQTLDRTRRSLATRYLLGLMSLLFAALPFLPTYHRDDGFGLLLWSGQMPVWASGCVVAVCLMNAAASLFGYLKLRGSLGSTGL